MNVEIKGDPKGRLCVFNCLDTPRGLEIAAEMLAWLEPLYQVHVVHHDGSKFEYHGIACLKYLTEKTGEPCLYLHTKGACNHPVNSPWVRSMWRCEFGDSRRSEMYFNAVRTETPIVACPISGPSRITRYNGFVVNPAAMQELGEIPETDRLWYETMWKRKPLTDVRAMKYWGSLAITHKLLELEYGQ